jgi:serine/threonine-protein kinase
VNELEDLLQRRLRVFTLALVVGTSVVVVLNYFYVSLTPRLLWLNVVPNVLILCLGAIPAALVWRRCRWSMNQLRWMERGLFAVTTLACAWWEFRRLYLEGLLSRYAERDPMEMAFLARYHGALWFVLLVGYGLLIPNTGRRCAAITGLVVLVALGSASVNLLLTESVGAVRAVKYLGDLAVFLAMGLGIAVYGAQRVHVLQQRVAAAREFGSYRLKERLGAGGMGEVFLAEHRLLKRLCAVKLIRPERAGDARLVQRFEREAWATTRLSHPNAVQVYDYGHTEDGTFYYAMEYLPGLSLDEIVKRYGPLPPERAVYLLCQVCGALREAHGLGLIHRDIKPSNIMVCQFGDRADVAKLLDFGLVLSVEWDDQNTKLTEAGLILGTPHYMSPEQARGEVTLGPSCDVYSLGATAYYLLTGRPPFVGKTVMETLVARLSLPVLPPSQAHQGIPADLEEVVMRSLARDPSQRYPDAGSLEAALAQCECAGLWTQEQAAAWWKSSGAAPLPPGVAALPRTTAYVALDSEGGGPTAGNNVPV